MGVQRGGKFTMVEGNRLLSEETGSTEWGGGIWEVREKVRTCVGLRFVTARIRSSLALRCRLIFMFHFVSGHLGFANHSMGCIGLRLVTDGRKHVFVLVAFLLSSYSTNKIVTQRRMCMGVS